jgi:MFS family permease
MDWWGNITFALGLVSILVGITYGIQPYGSSAMGWSNPGVLAALIGGALVLVLFVVIENKVPEPLFRLSLFRLRAFTAGNVANLLISLGRGGLQFALIIWLQGIWLPLHGYSFESTPLWAGIYMIPLTVGLLLAAPVSGWLSDRFGPRAFTVGGALVIAASFGALMELPTDFDYWIFALLLVLNGVGSGLFISPNRAEIMNSVPAESRGVGAGMNATFQNAASVLSIGIFFSLMVAGLTHTLPPVLHDGLIQQGVPASQASALSHLPPIGVLFAAFLGYNPFQQLLGNSLAKLPDGGAHITSKEYFPHLIAEPFHKGLVVAFWFAVTACLIAAVSSLLTDRVSRKHPAPARPAESLGSELAAVSGEGVLGPSELVVPDEPPRA